MGDGKRDLDGPQKGSLLSLHHWLGHAVVLLQSFTVHAPRYVFVIK